MGPGWSSRPGARRFPCGAQPCRKHCTHESVPLRNALPASASPSCPTSSCLGRGHGAPPSLSLAQQCPFVFRCPQSPQGQHTAPKEKEAASRHAGLETRQTANATAAHRENPQTCSPSLDAVLRPVAVCRLYVGTSEALRAKHQSRARPSTWQKHLYLRESFTLAHVILRQINGAAWGRLVDHLLRCCF